MKKRAYLFLFLLPAILILGGCGKKVDDNKIAPAAQNNTPVNNTQNNVVTETKEPETMTISSSFEGLMKGGKSLACTFSSVDEKEGTSQIGEYFVDGAKSKFRTEFESTSKAGEKVKSYIIADGQYAYSWSSASPKMGYKMSFSSLETVSAGADGQEAGDLDQTIKFNCRNWSVDSSKFDLPADVKFTDMDEMMKSLNIPRK